LIETEGANRLVRYQSADLTQSAQIETDAVGRVISYEEYHPFGTTAYQARDKAIVAAAKRYRYSGMERDEESGLEYHSARYYAPWLGRWIAPDLHAECLDGSRYAYVKNNPVINRDSNGMFEELTHGILTYRLALAAGFPPEEAARVAIATAAMDHDADTSPISPGQLLTFQFWKIPQTVRYHFPDNPFVTALGGVDRDIAEQRSGARRSDDLERFGQHLHTLEDIGFTDAPGPHMRHDPGRPVTRSLSPTLAVAGWGIASGSFIGAIFLFKTGTGAGVGVGIFVGLIGGYGLLLIVTAGLTSDIGHPSYTTERGEKSHSLSHVADQAPQDPKANTAEMMQVYEKLKEYARARYGAVQTDDAGAAAAIETAVTADNACLVSNFANTRPLDLGGVPRASYSEILRSRTADRGLSWLPKDIDVTNPANRGAWQYSTGIRVCR
jgi:RHS repeat-associated protein